MKKRFLKILIVIICCLTFMISLSGCAFGVNESIKYEDVDGGVALYRYFGVSLVDTLVIPDEFEGKPVVGIQKTAISSAEYIKTLKIGKNVKFIEKWGITNCPSLERIIVDENNEYFETDENGILYNKGKTELILYPTARDKLEKDKNGNIIKGAEVVIPDSVRKIADHAFYLSYDLYKITFNEGLEEIGDFAFHKNENLTNFILPSTLKVIGIDAFSYCDSVNALSIPKSVTTIKDYAFFSLSSTIPKIYIEGSRASITEGTNWIPCIKGKVNIKVDIVELNGNEK